MAEPEDGRPAIGIDLGTTNTRVGIWVDEENRFQLISDDLGCQSTPSYVAFTETERLIGDAAKAQVAKNPSHTIFDAKRLIGRKFSDLGTDDDRMHVQWPFRVARGEDENPELHVQYKGKEKVFSAVDVCTMVLEKMKDLAEVYTSSVVNGACVSVPHCFTSAQRQATRIACSLAGFESVTLVNEPVCAALAYTLNTIGPSLGEKTVMVFDLGGGSLDVSLFRIEGGVVEVKATSGDSKLGGEDFDLKLLHHFIQEIKQKHERDITSHPRVVRRLKQQVERVKMSLSSELETTIQIDSLLEDFNFFSTISRACFEEMNMEFFQTCIKHVEECLQRAEIQKQDVDEVVLVGGSSRIPKVQELLAEFFNEKSKLNTTINPDEAVVCGAAARAGISRGCSAFADYLVVDVVPMSLGLEAFGGAMHVMHPRGSAIPRSSEQLFTTVHDDQPGIFIQVYEGENPQTCDNMLIATIELPGIPPASRGVPQILVRFDVDAVGILTVSARDKTSGEKVEIYMDQDIDLPHHDEELRQRFPIQVFHPSSVSENGNDHPSSLGPHESSIARESISPREFSEPSSTVIQSTSQEVPEAYESGNSAENRSQEVPEAYESGNSAENRSQVVPEAYESRNSEESRSQEVSEAYESRNFEESRSQEVSEAYEIRNSEESKSQEDSPAFESSNIEETWSQEFFFESPQAFESSNSVESMSLEPPVAFESRDTTEKSVQESPEPMQAHEPNSIAEVSESQEFSEPPASESGVSLVQEILDTAHVITAISDFKTHKKECSTFMRRVNMLVPLFEEFRDLELSLSEDVLACFNSLKRVLNTARDLILLCSKGSKLWLILEEGKVAEQFLLLNTALVQALDKLPDSLGISDEVREQVDLVHSQLKRSKPLEEAVDAQLNAELVPILDQPNERSPDQLTRLTESFKLDTASVLSKEFEALDWMTKGPAPSFASTRGFDRIFGLLSDLRTVFPSEDPEQHDSSKLSGALEEPSNVVEGSSQEILAPPPLAPSNSSNSLKGSSQEFPAQPPQVNRDEESSSQEFSAQPPQVTRVEESRSQEFAAQPPRSAYSSSNSIDGRSLDVYSEPGQVESDGKMKVQEFAAPPPRSPYSSSNSIDGRSLDVYSEPAQVESDGKMKGQEFAAPPPRSPYNSSNSIDGRSLDVYSEPAQVESDGKMKVQEFAAQPPRSAYSSSNSIDGRSRDVYSEPAQVESDGKMKGQEFAAPPPRSPYSSSNSIDGGSLDGRSLDVYSEPAQVDRDEKMKLQEFSTPQPTYKPSPSFDGRPSPDHSESPQDHRSKSTFGSRSLPSHSASTTPEMSQEFAAQPPRSPCSSSNSIDGRSRDAYSEPAQVDRDHEKMKLPASSAPQLPTYKPSLTLEGRPLRDHLEAPQEQISNSAFGSRSTDPVPSHSASTTPERSQEFSEYSSKPEFPEHSPGLEYKAWNGLEGKPPVPSNEPLPTTYRTNSSPSASRRHDNFERSPSYRSGSTSEVSSGEFSGSGLLRAQHPVSEPPELRRSITSADDPLVHPPRPENARTASCPQIRSSDSIIEDVVKRYTWDQVLEMTNGLAKTIGKGGFGAVYLGKLETEKEVAVKVLDAGSQQGITEFLNEVNLLKRVNHVNLVRLLGYCLDESTNLQVLIYEFAEEGSIWDHLQVGGKSLDWRTRLHVALHSAIGLEYLHTGCHPRIIHRDIKSQNILLTKAMVAKVADFGLSKLGADQDNVSKTHVTTMVKGTLGYLDPEYLKTGQLTEKSDVYSFGVVLLEIVTGRKPIQNTDRKGFLGDWVDDHYNSNSSSTRGLKSVADPTLGSQFNPKALKMVLNIAKDCITPFGMDRPEMTTVVHVLRKAQMIEHDEKKPSKWLPFL